MWVSLPSAGREAGFFCPHDPHRRRVLRGSLLVLNRRPPANLDGTAVPARRSSAGGGRSDGVQPFPSPLVPDSSVLAWPSALASCTCRSCSPTGLGGLPEPVLLIGSGRQPSCTLLRYCVLHVLLHAAVGSGGRAYCVVLPVLPCRLPLVVPPEPLTAGRLRLVRPSCTDSRVVRHLPCRYDVLFLATWRTIHASGVECLPQPVQICSIW